MEIGKAAHGGWKIGDRVTALPFNPCHHCQACMAGLPGLWRHHRDDPCRPWRLCRLRHGEKRYGPTASIGSVLRRGCVGRAAGRGASCGRARAGQAGRGGAGDRRGADRGGRGAFRQARRRAPRHRERACGRTPRPGARTGRHGRHRPLGEQCDRRRSAQIVIAAHLYMHADQVVDGLPLHMGQFRRLSIVQHLETIGGLQIDDTGRFAFSGSQMAEA